MKIGPFELGKRPFIVAEIGNNHEGNFSLAQEMIGLAAEAGADAVKFQTFKTANFIHKSLPDRMARLSKFELTYPQFESLAATAKSCGIIFLSTPFDLESAEFLSTIVPAFKIGSGENTFYWLHDLIASKAKPIIMSCGLADLDQVAYAKARIESHWKDKNVDPGLALLHCISSYPTLPGDAHLGMIKVLRDRFNCVVGYSDHTIGVDAPLAAVALGAQIIEKHFTKSKTFSDFRDHQLSADPPELKLLVDKAKEIVSMLGSGDRKLGAKEAESLIPMRRSMATLHELPKGHAITSSDIIWLRPGGGVSPNQEDKILGRRLVRDLARGDFIQTSDVE